MSGQGVGEKWFQVVETACTTAWNFKTVKFKEGCYGIYGYWGWFLIKNNSV